MSKSHLKPTKNIQNSHQNSQKQLKHFKTVANLYNAETQSCQISDSAFFHHFEFLLINEHGEGVRDRKIMGSYVLDRDFDCHDLNNYSSLCVYIKRKFKALYSLCNIRYTRHKSITKSQSISMKMHQQAALESTEKTKTRSRSSFHLPDIPSLLNLINDIDFC